MEKKENLWKTSLELNEILDEVNDDVEAVLKRYQSNIATTEHSIFVIRELKQTLSKTNF